MKRVEHELELKAKKPLHVYLLGTFRTELEGEVRDELWKRERSAQLFQYLLIHAESRAVHKEQITDRIWDGIATDQDFKVALHGINKVIEPSKASRKPSRFITRIGASYSLESDHIWTDFAAMERYIHLSNDAESDEEARLSLRLAVDLYQGILLPNRIYEDWTSGERERLQLLALGAMVRLAESLVSESPDESIRLTEHVLKMDETWEEAYRIQMQAFIENGNRPKAIHSYQRCVEVLHREYDIPPLPDTKKLFQSIIDI